MKTNEISHAHVAGKLCRGINKYKKKIPQLEWSIFQLVTVTSTFVDFVTFVLSAHFVEQYSRRIYIFMDLLFSFCYRARILYILKNQLFALKYALKTFTY
jgi:hypothetical protein